MCQQCLSSCCCQAHCAVTCLQARLGEIDALKRRLEKAEAALEAERAQVSAVTAFRPVPTCKAGMSAHSG